MKYLKRFNESNLNLQEVINDCQDILIDLADDGVKYQVGLDSGLVININDERRIKLKKYADNFNRLFDYLESLGFKLDKTSYYESDGWDHYERCPNCHSQSTITGKEDVANWKTDDLQCTDCGYKGHYSDFQVTEHPLTKSEFMWSVKSGDMPDNIHLFFTLNEQ